MLLGIFKIHQFYCDYDSMLIYLFCCFYENYFISKNISVNFMLYKMSTYILLFSCLKEWQFSAKANVFILNQKTKIVTQICTLSISSYTSKCSVSSI